MEYECNSRESIVILRCRMLFEATRPYVERYNDEVFIGSNETTLTREQMNKLVRYRLSLRDIEKSAGFPNGRLPTSPSFFVEARRFEDEFEKRDALFASQNA